MRAAGRTTAAQTAGPARTVHVAGDSTAAAKPASAAPMTGWAMALPFLLGPHLAVANHARDGRSSRSFLTEGRLAALLPALRPGDLLLIQFGHNDQKADDPSRFTDPATDYRRNLLSLVRAARACGARPVLLTPVERRRYDADGRALPTHGAYAEAVRALATAERVPLLDIQAQSLALWQRLGPEGSKKAFLWLRPGRHPNHPHGVRDDTHLAPWGAAEVARMVARGLGTAGVLSPGDLRRPADAVPDAWIAWPRPSLPGPATEGEPPATEGEPPC
ncbi:rhamnogalacturonan acetylesterase [Streptomyces viridiviolaceus]